MYCVYCGRPIHRSHLGHFPEQDWMKHYTVNLMDPSYNARQGIGRESISYDETSAYWAQQEASDYAKQFDQWAR